MSWGLYTYSACYISELTVITSRHILVKYICLWWTCHHMQAITGGECLHLRESQVAKTLPQRTISARVTVLHASITWFSGRRERSAEKRIWIHGPRSEKGQSFTDTSQAQACSEVLLIVCLRGCWVQKLISPATNFVNFINELLTSSEDPSFGSDISLNHRLIRILQQG